MPVELISWLSAVLVVASVVIKIVTANLITRRKTEVSQLQSELRKQVGVCESLVEHRASLDDNLEFFERRMIEDREVKVELATDLAAYVADYRKHLEDLGYDPDEDPDPEAIYEEAATAGSEPSQEFQQADALPQHATIAVLPPAVGDADKLFLPDAVITELLSGGGKVIDRSTINQRLIDNDVDLRQVLDIEEPRVAGVACAVRIESLDTIVIGIVAHPSVDFGGVDGGGDGARPVGGGNARAHPFPRLDGDRERRLVTGFVAVGHEGQVQLLDPLRRQGQAD